jgi:hypothetical protein
MRNEVAREEWLYRRGYSRPEKNYMNPDGTATSRVFKLRPLDNGELSVDVKSMTTSTAAVRDAQKFMLFEVSNHHVINCGLRTEHDPLPNEHSAEDNPAHAVVIGMTDDDDVTPGLLAKGSRRVSAI